jgi:hypothetical protein
MRHAWTVAALAAGGLLAAGVAAPAAMAADDCPNAAVRAQQAHASSLPYCMAYERITPNDKNGAYLKADSPLKPDGSAVSVWSTVQLSDDDTGGLQQLGTAHRGADGWTIHMLSNSPEWGQRRVSSTVDVAWWLGLSEDFGTLLYRTNYPLAPGDDGGSGFTNTPDFYLSRPDRPHLWVTAPVSGTVPTGAQTGSTPRIWRGSPDMERIVFDTTRVLDPDADATVRQHIWLFREGARLEAIDRLPDGSLSTATQVLSGTQADALAGARASKALESIVFLSSAWHGNQHVYARVGAGTPEARTVLVSADATGTPCPVAPTFDHVTENGRFVRFTCAAQLTPEAPPTGGAYVRDLVDGSVTYDEPAADRGSPAVRYRITGDWTRPEGTYRLERTGSGAAQQLYRTDLSTNVRECVSCPTDGSTPTASSQVGGGSLGISGGAGITAENHVTPEGDVVFQTDQRLVPEDTNGMNDVYLWKDGRHHLLTTGTTVGDAQLGGVSLDGSTITIATVSSLVPEDQDRGARDIYAIVRGGGFLRSGAASECEVGCQGPAILPPAVIVPLSIGFAGGEHAEDDGDRVDPIVVSGSRSVRGSSVKVKVRVPGAGRVSLSGSGLRAVSRSLKRASSATLTVKLSARSQRLLKRRSSLRLRLTVRYASATGGTQSKRVTLTFRRKATKRKAASRTTPRASAAAAKGAR